MKVHFALCAQSASVDRSTSRISIFNVFDHFPVASTPINIPSVTFVSVVEADRDDQGEARGRLEIFSDEKPLGGVDIPITFTDNRLARVIVNFTSLPILGPGLVRFFLLLPDGVRHESSFRVVNVAGETALSTVATTPPR